MPPLDLSRPFVLFDDASAKGGDAISHDDVLDFHDLLNTPDWFVTLATMNDR